MRIFSEFGMVSANFAGFKPIVTRSSERVRRRLTLWPLLVKQKYVVESVKQDGVALKSEVKFFYHDPFYYSHREKRHSTYDFANNTSTGTVEKK